MTPQQLGKQAPPFSARARRSTMLAVGWLVLLAGAFAYVAMRNGSGRSPVSRFLVAMAVIVLVSNLVGGLFARLGQPAVVGEILGGLLLGPSGLGLLWSHAQRWLLPADTVDTLNMVAQLGLVTFMFLLGSEVRLTTGRRNAWATIAVTSASMGLPFVAGLLLSWPARGILAGEAPKGAAYPAFVGLALSITALPVLARILLDFELTGTQLGNLALSCAAASDGIAWAVFTLVLAIGSGHALPGIASIVLLGGGLTLATWLLVRPGLAAVARYVARGPGAEHLALPVLIGGALAYAGITDYAGLHPIIGAFVFGVVVPRDRPVFAAAGKQLRAVTMMILLPVFFAGVGLNLVVQKLAGSARYWLFFTILLVAAVGTKFAASWIGGQVAHLSRPDVLRLGALLNCRGVTEIVVATVGLQTGIISLLGFTMLVLLALLSTLVTGPLLRLIGTGGATPRPMPVADETDDAEQIWPESAPHKL